MQPYSGPPITLTDDDTISPINQGILSLSHSLSKVAQTATMLSALRISSLISLGQLCDDDCVVLLNKEKLYAVKKNRVIL